MGLDRAIKVGLTIVGTAVGAGFASGREIWEFFSSYGKGSQYSLLLAMGIIFIVIAIILSLSQRNETTHYYDILEKIMGRELAKVFDVMTMLYLLSMTIVMFAGSGATFAQWNMPFLLGVVFIAVAVFCVLIFNVKGLVSIQTFIIPLLIGVLLFVCARHILDGQGFVSATTDLNLPSWPSGVTYAALHIVPLLAVLSTLGKELKTAKELWVAAAFSAIALGALAFALNQALIHSGDRVAGVEIPLFSLLANNSVGALILVSVVLWLAIYTTALSGVHGIVSRIQPVFTMPSWLVALVIIVGVIPLSLFGFSTLVGVLYPIYGVINLFVLGLLVLYPINNMIK